MANLVSSREPKEPADGEGQDRPWGGRNPRNQARHRKVKRKGSFWRELPILVLTALVLTFLIQTFLARVYVIPSASMEPTLHGCTGCTNDRVLVDKVTYRFSDPQPGDVVVFRGPASWGANTEFTTSRSENIVVRGLQQAASLIGLAPPDERDFVKRVIAVGGQTVQCCDAQNRVMVDGAPLNEPYPIFIGREPQESFGPVTVPKGSLWMMGDNRNNSADSRRHMGDERKGTVPVANVIGKARVIVLPPPRWRGIDDTNPQQHPATALGTPAPDRATAMPARPTDVPTGLPLAAGVALSLPVARGGRMLGRRVGTRKRG